jgi:hypothetical protein
VRDDRVQENGTEGAEASGRAGREDESALTSAIDRATQLPGSGAVEARDRD